MEPVVIEFIGDTRGLEPAIEQLKALGQVTEAQYDQFISANKKSEEAIKNVEKRLKSQTDASVKDIGEQTQAMQQLSDAIPLKVIEENGKQMEKTAAKSKTLKQQLREVKEEMAQLELAGKSNTQRFKELAIQGGILTDQLGDTSAQLRNLGNDEKYIQAVGQAMTGLVGVFSAGQGAVALFGDENEDLQKTMMRLFAAMSIVQGLESAMVALNKDSILSTTAKIKVQQVYNYFIDQTTGKLIAARVAAVGFATVGIAAAIIGIIYYFRKLNDEIEESKYQFQGSAVAQEEYIDVQTATQKAVYDTTVEMNALLKVARDETKTRNEQNEAIRQLNDKYGDYLGNITQENKNSAEVNEQIKKYIELTGLKAKAQAIYNLLVTKNEQYYSQIAEAEATRNQRSEDYIKILNDETASQRSKERAQRMVNIAAGEYDETIAKLNDTQNQSVGINKEYELLVARIIELENQRKFVTADTAEQVKKVVRETYAELKPITPIPSPSELKTNYTEPGLKITKDYAAQIEEASAKSREQLKADLDEIAAKRKQHYNEAANIALQTFNVIGQFNQNALDKELQSLDQQLANKQISQDKYDALSKEAKVKQAKQAHRLALFEATVNAISAVVEALPNIPLSIAVGALGALQIAAIAGEAVPGFYKGTPKAPAGFKWVGEKGPELINDGGGYPIINNDDSMALISMLSKYNIPSVPSLSEASLNMLSAGYGVPVLPGMDYDKMAEAFAGEVKNNPGLSVNIDEKGFVIFLKKQFGTTYFIDNKYRKN